MNITPVYQAQSGLGGENESVGDCMRASLATVTGMGLEDVPHFVENYMKAMSLTVLTMTDMDWLTVLGDVMTWLNHVGYETKVTISTTEPRTFDPCLAMVPSQQYEDIPHIIVTDSRGIQVWDPQPLNTRTYQPGEIQAMLMVTKKGAV